MKKTLLNHIISISLTLALMSHALAKSPDGNNYSHPVEVGDIHSFQLKGIPYIKDNKVMFIIYDDYHDFKMKKSQINIAEIYYTPKNELNVVNKRKLIGDMKSISLVGMVNIKNETYIYYLEADSSSSKSKMKRIKINSNKEISDSKIINIDFNLTTISSPNLTVTPDGSIALVYRNYSCCKLGYAMSSDGLNFKETDSVNISGFMSNTTSNSKAVIYTFQGSYKLKSGTNKKTIAVMKSKFITSINNGHSWSNENYISNDDLEVHDAYPFRQLNDDIIILYSRPQYNNGPLSIYSKCVSKTGGLNEEELIIGDEFSDIAKPSIYSIDNNSSILLYIDQSSNSHQLKFKILNNLINCQD